MLEPFLVLLPVALLVPSGPTPVRLPWSSLLTWGLLYATVGHHAGKVLGTVVAHDGRVVPPGRDTRAEEEPEYAGGAAVEKDVLIWVHDGEVHGRSNRLYSRARAMDDASVRRWLGTMPGTLAIWCRRSGSGG